MFGEGVRSHENYWKMWLLHIWKMWSHKTCGHSYRFTLQQRIYPEWLDCWFNFFICTSLVSFGHAQDAQMCFNNPYVPWLFVIYQKESCLIWVKVHKNIVHSGILSYNWVSCWVSQIFTFLQVPLEVKFVFSDFRQDINRSYIRKTDKAVFFRKYLVSVILGKRYQDLPQKWFLLFMKKLSLIFNALN